jgi:hypothetical protein
MQRAGWRPRTDLRLALLFGLAVFCASLGTVQAQPQLTFRAISVSWPTVRLDFSVKCHGVWSNTFEKQHFKVYEDSIEVGEFELFCPDGKRRCAIAVALVLDGSGSMGGEKNYSTRQAANVFVDNMDGVNDRAAVIWFDSRDTLVQGLTANKTLLKAAIDSLPATGTTAAWDATYSGILELLAHANGNDTCGAVILLTDGNDNASVHSLGELAAFARSKNVRVYTVGLGADANVAALSHLAGETQGKFFRVLDLAQLDDIYQDIFMDVAGIENCSISYTGACSDGMQRRVDLRIQNFCGGTDAKWLTYTAPAYTTNPTLIDIAIPDTSAKENESIIIPVELLTPIEATAFPVSTVTVTFDSSILVYEALGPLTGCLLQSAGLSAKVFGNTVVVTSARKVQVAGTGTLFRLRFRTRVLDQTTCGRIRPFWEFNAGCLKPRVFDSEVCVLAKEPRMRCDIDMPSKLLWDRNKKEYAPNPILVRGFWVNTGEKAAKGARVTIEYDPARVRVLSPSTDEQILSPGTVAPGDTLRVEWLVRALPRGATDTASICLKARFENAPLELCCARFTVDVADPALTCDIAIPALTADSLNLRYAPSPLDLVVTVANVGGLQTDTVTVTLDLPAQLRMADGLDTPVKILQPATLRPGERGIAVWRVRVPVRNAASIADIAVRISTKSLDTAACALAYPIPALHAPVLDAVCAVPAVLYADTARWAYSPDPFDVSLRVGNAGDRAASNLAATLLLPPGMELVNPAEQLRKTFVPSTIAPYTTGPSAPLLQWRVRMARRSTKDVYLPFRWLIEATGPGGHTLDTMYSVCTTQAGAFPTDLVCALSMPEAIRSSPDSVRLVPASFTLRGTYRNIGLRGVRLEHADAFVTPDGMRFDPGTPPYVSVERTLAPGDSVVVSWTVHIDSRTYARLNECRIRGVDDQANEVECAGTLPIDGIPAELVCALMASNDTVRFDAETGQRLPPSWTVAATVTNNGKRILNDVRGALRWTANTLVEADPSAGDTATVKSSPLVFPGQSRLFVWPFRLRDNADTIATAQRAHFSLETGSRETSPVADACAASVVIAPSRIPRPQLACAVFAPDTIHALDTEYFPSPFAVDLRIDNVGTAPARNCRAYLLQNERVVAASPSQRTLGDLRAGERLDIPAVFLLRANPVERDTVDTLRIAVLSDDAPPLQCMALLRIEKARAPALAVSCAPLPDTVRYSTVLRRFVPDTISLAVSVRNIGDAPATDVRISFAGSSAFFPCDSTSTVFAGTLAAGAVENVIARLRAIPSASHGHDTLRVSALGRGGYGNLFVSASCSSAVRVEREDLPALALLCMAPDTLSPGVDALPFAFRATLSNTGLKYSAAGSLSIALPAGVTLDSAETATKPAGVLSPGGALTLTWRLRATAGSAERLEAICATFRADNEDSARCCASVVIRAAGEALLQLDCAAPDSLHLDDGRQAYRDSPFLACVRVRNAGTRPVSGLRVRLSSPSPRITIADTAARVLPGALQPGASSSPLCWSVDAAVGENEETASLSFTVSSLDVATSTCDRSVLLPGRLPASLSVAGFTTPADTLHFDFAAQDFEGVPSLLGNYTVFTLSATARNEGAATAKGLRLQLLPPEGIAFEGGESAEKRPAVDSLPPGGSASLSWLLTAARRRDGANRKFLVRAAADNAAPREASVNLFVQGAPLLARFRIPDTLTAVAGQTLSVPVTVDATAFGPVSSYRLLVAFDPSLLSLRDARTAGTLTTIGWNGPEYGIESIAPDGRAAVLQVGDSTSRVPLRGEGALVTLLFDVHGTAQPGPWVRQTSLAFARTAQGRDGVVRSDALNGQQDAADGVIAFEYRDGLATLADHCVVPLSGSAGATRLQNTPNPFNPSTTIRFSLPRETAVRLAVLDVYGRMVRLIADRIFAKGEHALHFDASDLPAGVYFGRLDADGATAVTKMILLK